MRLVGLAKRDVRAPRQAAVVAQQRREINEMENG